MKPEPRRKHPPPWASADFDIADVSAIQALDRGEANPDQQRRALKWIVERACQIGEDAFVPGHPEVTQYIVGRQSPGKQIVKLMKLNLSQMRSHKS